MQIVVHTLSRGRQFIAGFWSLAFGFRVLVFIANIVFSFLIAYGTRNLWTKESAYHERPHVDFKHIVVGVAEGDQGSYAFGNLQSYNSVFGSNVRIPIIRASIEEDIDAVALKHTVELEFPLMTGENIKSVKGVLLFDYMVESLVRIQMESAAFFAVSSPLPMREAQVDGSLRLVHDKPLPVSSAYLTHGDTALVASDEVLSLEDVRFAALQSKYNARNLTTHLWPVLSTFETGTLDRFVARVIVRIPLQRIIYKPTVMEVCKFAWIQFVCILLVLWWISERALDILYDQQVFRTRVVDLGVSKRLH